MHMVIPFQPCLGRQIRNFRGKCSRQNILIYTRHDDRKKKQLGALDKILGQIVHDVWHSDLAIETNGDWNWTRSQFGTQYCNYGSFFLQRSCNI